MRIITFKETIEDKGEDSVMISQETHNVVASFMMHDCLTNVAHVHMSPIEARSLAQRLIIYADKLDPIK